MERIHLKIETDSYQIIVNCNENYTYKYYKLYISNHPDTSHKTTFYKYIFYLNRKKDHTIKKQQVFASTLLTSCWRLLEVEEIFQQF